ncbi:ADP-ribosylglycohydrolase family protein [bacterium]|nr:ADP-ribosylglycohydrolase family protein [bacterium]
MYGAIIGDIIGSRFERNNIKSVDFELFTKESRVTDDSILTVAIAKSILYSIDYSYSLREFALKYPHVGYGKAFKEWAIRGDMKRYDSWGNGSAMRVSPIGYSFKTLEETLDEAESSAKVTHNHPEGIKGAKAIATAVFMARVGYSKSKIKNYISDSFNYDLDRAIIDIREDYKFDVSCQGSVPEAIISFLESSSFEEAIRIAVSIGGDSDTIASMSGAIAEAYYQDIPKELIAKANLLIPSELILIIDKFRERYITPKFR